MKSFIYVLIFSIFYYDVFSQNEVSSDDSINRHGQFEAIFDSQKGFYYLLSFESTNNKIQYSSIILGDGKRLTITEPAKSLSLEKYKILKFPISNPNDSDKDGKNDIEELNSYSGFNAAKSISEDKGALSILEHKVFSKMSFKGDITGPDQHLSKLEFIKFTILVGDNLDSELYFINTENFRSHESFRVSAQINSYGKIGIVKSEIRGELVYHPNLLSDNGLPGLYRFQFQPDDNFSFERVELAYDIICRNLPFLKNNLSYYPAGNKAELQMEKEINKFSNSRIPIISESKLYQDIVYNALNQAESYGFLKFYDENKAVNISDILILNSLPNDISRTSGFISLVPQTPLSHVNLRAIQDGIPNAYIKNAEKNEKINSLLGKYVRLKINQKSYEISVSSKEEYEIWRESKQLKKTETLEKNLIETKIKSLNLIAFKDWKTYGVKCANLATLKTFGFEKGTILDGYGIPFYFYDTFIKYNNFDKTINEFLTNNEFKNNTEYRKLELKKLRQKIKEGKIPEWMISELSKLQYNFPVSSSIRCRSSTNNEDLQNFNGAGLYTSKTHKPLEGHISKTIKEIYAGLWNFRAFEEREFLGIDHFSVAMGVLCHINTKEEKANGVAVSTDPLYYNSDVFYLNNQVGEDLVTNPDSNSKPEELLLDIIPVSKDPYRIVSYSNKSPEKLILDNYNLDKLRYMITIIKRNFKELYSQSNDSLFNIEIEYKINKSNALIIKQIRPWLGSNTSTYDDKNLSIKMYNKAPEILPLEVSLYPNPVMSTFTLKYPAPEKSITKLEIYDVLGRRIHEIVLKPENYNVNIVSINMNEFTNSSGQYYVRIVQKTQEVTYQSISKLNYLKP